ncbi:MAG: hypothetical protein HKN36_04770 [Hellea sp.]|nr:hypothetical protein [Hellea sp.]
MKKLSIILISLLLVLAGIFIWLVSKAGPENANTETITVTIEDNFEK